MVAIHTRMLMSSEIKRIGDYVSDNDIKLCINNDANSRKAMLALKVVIPQLLVEKKIDARRVQQALSTAKNYLARSVVESVYHASVSALLYLYAIAINADNFNLEESLLKNVQYYANVARGHLKLMTGGKNELVSKEKS